MQTYLDFEKSIAELESRISDLRNMDASEVTTSIEEELERLEDKSHEILKETYAELDPWQKTQVARHPARPHFTDYVSRLVEEFSPLAGDRKFSEDKAIIGGLGRFMGRPVVIMGHEKGSTTQARVEHNFGMARPEGYRKAVRLMELAEKFSLPVISLVDTAGAYPGVGAEERGQSEAIARATDCCLGINVPYISLIIGEGGSGGAVSIATANTVLMLEHSIYTVASPEAAASILWRDSNRAEDAAIALKITAQDLHKFGVCDEIIEEPVGGAHRRPEEAIDKAGEVILEALSKFDAMSPEAIRAHRHDKFLSIGRNL